MEAPKKVVAKKLASPKVKKVAKNAKAAHPSYTVMVRKALRELIPSDQPNTLVRKKYFLNCSNFSYVWRLGERNEDYQLCCEHV